MDYVSLSHSSLFFVFFCMTEQHTLQTVPVATLMELAKKGDRRAFGELYEEYLTPIFRYLLARTKDKELAEDLTQTVFMKALEHLEKSTAATPNTTQQAYFFAIARTTLMDFWKKKKEVALLSQDAPEMQRLADERPGAIEHLTQEEYRAMIDQGLSLLTDDQQEVIVLRFLNDTSHHDIARLLGKNETTIRQLQCRGLKTLRNYFATYHSS